MRKYGNSAVHRLSFEAYQWCYVYIYLCKSFTPTEWITKLWSLANMFRMYNETSQVDFCVLAALMIAESVYVNSYSASHDN